MNEARRIRVTVLYSPRAREMHEWHLDVEEGGTVLQALEFSGLQSAFPGLDLHSAVAGVWGRKARLQQCVRDGDRVEIYRPLKVDPKVARRERFRKQGSRAAGLFAGKR